MTTIFMKIDFPIDTATLSGMSEQPITKTISKLSAYTTQWNTQYFFEYPLNNEGRKWVFTWSQWIEHENFFKLEMYCPFPDNTIPTPLEYKPWTVLAKWSYIPRPHKGTIQQTGVYRNCYRHDQFPDKHIQFEMIGMNTWPTWNSKISTDGYWH